ncbi:alcohol dehydrogenase [Siphonobacter sp. BAB-5405]|uniref:aldo/keto reductase n=1 Tax=Siphonobacter sp. BAB-5405 TaxID=1864825 RepID=UPI000C7FFE9E|nr:aldo/keto reductase [Siphonobacter sp. BAB-5405]PMD99563.1 alcohol dehydrogenase [Siphonobacter sp. BAB-5405]
MQKRALGKSNIEVAPLAFGGNVFGWTIDETTSFEILDAFVAAGFNFIDTADVYSRWVPGNIGGESETILGKWMKQRNNREQIILATKIGADNGKGHPDVSKAYILKGVEDSLRRLQTEYIDLYQTHYDNESTPVEETLEAYDQLVKAGKVRIIGTSNMSPERLKASLQASEKNGYPRYETLQPNYSLVERKEYEEIYEPIVREHQLSTINYYSLASGFLTGKYRSEADLAKSQRGQGVKKYLNEQGLGILKALDEVAEEYKVTPASVALAWLMARPSIGAPIASATSLNQLQSFIQAAELSLSTEAIEKLDQASDWK